MHFSAFTKEDILLHLILEKFPFHSNLQDSFWNFQDIVVCKKAEFISGFSKALHWFGKMKGKGLFICLNVIVF